MEKFSSSLELLSHVFGKVGWQKKLCELTEVEVLALIVVLQSVKDIEHEYLNEYLREVYEGYGIKREQDGWIPI